MIFILKMNYSSNKNTQKVINSQIREYFNFKIQIWKLQTKVKRWEILEQNMLLAKKKWNGRGDRIGKLESRARKWEAVAEVWRGAHLERSGCTPPEL